MMTSSKKNEKNGEMKNTKPRPLVCNLFLFLFFTLLYFLHFILIVLSILGCSVMGAHFFFSPFSFCFCELERVNSFDSHSC